MKTFIVGWCLIVFLLGACYGQHVENKRCRAAIESISNALLGIGVEK
jgi:hypothetical protein